MPCPRKQCKRRDSISRSAQVFERIDDLDLSAPRAMTAIAAAPSSLDPQRQSLAFEQSSSWRRKAGTTSCLSRVPSMGFTFPCTSPVLQRGTRLMLGNRVLRCRRCRMRQLR